MIATMEPLKPQLDSRMIQKSHANFWVWIGGLLGIYFWWVIPHEVNGLWLIFNSEFRTPHHYLQAVSMNYMISGLTGDSWSRDHITGNPGGICTKN